MRKLKFAASNLLLVMMCFMFATCSPDPEPDKVVKLDLIGVWKYSHSGGYDLYQFNNDGTGSGIDSDGYYWNFEYDLNTETLRLVYAKENESAEIWNIDVISNSNIGINNEMVLTRTTEKVERYRAVDLGLSVKWATCNVGASKPEDYGDYYAWGETTTKSDYSLETYKYRTTLTSSDDVATVKWGSKWRMPTKEEMQELNEDCTWTWTTQNGVNGMKVTGPNGNSIFLPAAGYRNGTDFEDCGVYGVYWSATLAGYGTYDAYVLLFESGYSTWNGLGFCFTGIAVRPVTD